MDFKFIAHVVKDDDESWRRQSMADLAEQFAEKIGFVEAAELLRSAKPYRKSAAFWQVGMIKVEN